VVILVVSLVMVQSISSRIRKSRFLPIFLILQITAVSAYGGRTPDSFTQICDSIFNIFLKRVDSAKEGPIGIGSFKRDLRMILERQLPKGAPFLKAEYMDLSYREWVSLQDPAFHLTILRYPVPEAAVEILSAALVNRISPAQVSKILESSTVRGSSRELLVWVQRLLEHPERRDGNLLKALVDDYKGSVVIARDRIKYLTGIPILPEPKPGHVRMYKGSNFFKGPALSQSQVGKPTNEIQDGGLVFLDQADANIHSVRAEAFHPDGVSVSADKTVPINYGSHIRIYEFPREVVEKLPRGAPGLNEYVFKYSVPERFRVRTLPKATYLELLKQDARRAYSNGELTRQASRNSGADLLNILLSKSDPILIRGRTLTFDGLISERTATIDRQTIQHHVLKILGQDEKYGAHFRWNEIQAPPNVDVRSVLNFSFVLHDIGKPIASELKASHQEISAEILSQMMNKAGCSRAEVELGVALVKNDVIGLMLQGFITPQQAFERLVEISKQTNLGPRDFFKVQSYFYTMDASSYIDLAFLFVQEGGMLIPKNEKFKVLRNLFENVEMKP
jgi:hypothetical protein